MEPFDAGKLVTVSDVRAAARRLFESDLSARPAVCHVAAVWAPGDGRNVVMKVGPETPRSSTDAFVLALSRARADAVLTTGKILRAEPGMSHRLEGPGTKALREWRRDVLGLNVPAHSVVLSRGKDLDPSHPVFDGRIPTTVLVPSANADRVSGQFAGASVHVVGLDDLDLRRAILWLHEEASLACVSVEAGPSTALALYEEPMVVQELLLSRYHGEALPPELADEELPDDEKLHDCFLTASRHVDPTTDWSFARYRA